MKTIAFIRDGIVFNIGEYDDDAVFSEEPYADGSIAVDITDIKDQVKIGYDYVDGKFAPHVITKEESIAKAEYDRSQLIALVKYILAGWQSNQIQIKAIVGTATEDEKKLLSDWLDYYDEVMLIDTNNAPDVTWPEQPANLEVN